jgi:hypothetical protein
MGLVRCFRTFFTASIQLRVCIIMIRLLFWLPNIKNREQKKRFDSSPEVCFAAACMCIERYTHTQRWWRMVTWGRRSWAKMPTVRDDNLLDSLVSTWTSRFFFLRLIIKLRHFVLFFLCVAFLGIAHVLLFCTKRRGRKRGTKAINENGTNELATECQNIQHKLSREE